MLDLIQLTPADGTSVKAAGAAPKEQVLDAAGYASMELVLTALSLGGNLSVRVETALTMDESQWQSLGVFTPLVAVGTTDRRRFEGVLRYLRWRVDEVTGGGAVFTIAGTVR